MRAPCPCGVRDARREGGLHDEGGGQLRVGEVLEADCLARRLGGEGAAPVVRVRVRVGVRVRVRVGVKVRARFRVRVS